VSNDERADSELLDAAARGDAAAFGVLVRRYVRPATLLAAQLLGDADDAEDVVQDAFTIVHRSAGGFDASREFTPWFYAIIRRIAANRRARDRRRARLFSLWGGAAASEASTPPMDDALLARIDAAASATLAARAMELLSPMQRACFELVSLRDLSIAEVAAMHAISESTVRQHVFRARAALRAALGNRPGGSADQ
jgi:RNA polymerase sigma-70 factor (ECF subfamily)